MWRGVASRLRFDLEDGMKILCRARLSAYPPRGEYQLIVESVEPQGVGALQKAFEQLKARLATEGLFDESCKKALPLSLPTRRPGSIKTSWHYLTRLLSD